jgi:quinol monooxygenase YgiN
MPAVLTGFLICRSLEESDRVSQLLPAHIRATRAELGCVRYEVWRSRADPVRFAVHGVFTGRKAYDAHCARAGDSDWGPATRHVPNDLRVTDM